MRRFIIGLLLLSSSTVALAQEKIPTLVNIRTKADKKHVGEVLQQTDQATVLYDIVLRDTVRIESDQIKSMVEGISEASASSHVPFASYGAWKLTKLLKVGKIQGRIALVSDQGIFINLGTNAGIASGQVVKLLGKAETITDPETEEVLAVVRPTVAMLKVTQVVNEKLSKVTLTPPETKVSIERGMLVECDRKSRTVVVIPPKWKSEDPNLKTGDEALYLTEHMLAELVGYGIPVISRDQVERIREQLAATKGQVKEDVAAIAIAEEVKAGVMLTGELLAKGNFGNVFFHVTDVKTAGYLGVISGKVRRDRIRVRAEKAKATVEVVRLRGLNHTAMAKLLDITPVMARSLLLAMPFDQGTVKVSGATVHVQDISGRNRHGSGARATIAAVEEGVRGSALSFKDGDGILIDEGLLNKRNEYTIALWCTGGIQMIHEFRQPHGLIDLQSDIFRVHRYPQNTVLNAWNRLSRNADLGIDEWYRREDRLFRHLQPAGWEFLAYRVSGAALRKGRLRYTSGQKHFEGGTQMVFHDAQACRGFVVIGLQMQGQLDEVFVFDRALSDEEITILYERGAAGVRKK
jgi:hypothetical protein